MRWLAALLFAISGATALAYELAWSRMLAQEFGGTLLTTSAVISWYLVGLALGAATLGRFADRLRRPLLMYAGVELAVAVYAAASPWIIRNWIAPRVSASGGIGEMLLLTAVFLLPPTVLMGASFPAMLAAARHEERGVPGFFYGINTVGAAIGVLVTAFILLPRAGYSGTIALAASLNGIAAVVAALMRRVDLPRVAPVSASRGEPNVRPTRVLAILTLSGLAALIGEVAWTRALALVLGSSVYAFALILAAFLLGVGTGALAHARRSPTGQPMTDLAHYQARAATAAGFFAVLVIAAPWLVIEAIRAGHGSPGTMAAIAFGVSFAVTAYATTAFGASFPAGLEQLLRTSRPGRAAGLAYALNTVGAVTGSLVTTTVLIPRFGLASAMAIGVTASLAAYLLACGIALRPLLLAVAGSVAALALLPRWWLSKQELLISGVYAYAYRYATGETGLQTAPLRLPYPTIENQRPIEQPVMPAGLVFAKDGLHANVAVYRDDLGDLSLLLDGKADASTGLRGDMRTQLLLGHLPALLGPGRPGGRALVIGLGSGITVSAVLRHPVNAVTVVEIEPLVADVARRYFSVANGRALDDPRVDLHLGDGRRWVRNAAEPYNAITSEPSNLWMSGVTHLFTAEFFAEAAMALTDDGVLCQWMHLYQVSTEDVRIVLRGIAKSFDHIAMFLDGPDLLVVAGKAPLELPSQGQSFGADLAAVGLRTGEDLRALYIGDAAALRLFAGVGQLHTDDHPILEFTAPASLGQDRSAEIAGLLSGSLSP